jgi:lipopolysaccharide biosynthesis glycosyltransferase
MSQPSLRTVAPDTINLLLCCNQQYLQHLFVALASIAEQNTRYTYNVVVVMQAGDPDQLDALASQALANYRHMRVTFRTFVPDSQLVLPVRIHYTKDIFTRLWVAEFFAASVDRVLYLDSDLIVVDSLDPLWETPLQGRMLGAVSIPGSTRCATLGMAEEFGYFNSGVLLIDLAKWRRTKALDQLLEYIQANHSRLIDPDQDALNAVLGADRLPLPYEWNVISCFYFPYHDLHMQAADVRRVRERAKIIHFNGASKPWSYFSRHPRRGDYFRYLQRTPWRGFRPTDRTPLNRLRRLASTLLPERIKRLLR